MVLPMRARPEIEEFPDNSRGQPGRHPAQQPCRAAGFQVFQKGRPLPAVVERLEQKNESQPDEREKEPGKNEGQEQNQNAYS